LRDAHSSGGKAGEKGMKKSTVGETVLSFIFIFKGRRADFLIGNMKKKIV
jgi:hypothetical protein